MGEDRVSVVWLGEDRVTVQGGKTTADSEGSRWGLGVHLRLELFLGSEGSQSTNLQDQEV